MGDRLLRLFGKCSQVSIGEWFAPGMPHSVERHVRVAVAKIDAVHSVSDPARFTYWYASGIFDGELEMKRHRVEVEVDLASSDMGMYYPSRRLQGERSDGPKLVLNPSKGDVVGTVIHEAWHLISAEMLHGTRGLNTRTSLALLKLLRKVHSLSTYQACDQRRGGAVALLNLLKDDRLLADSVKADLAATAKFLEYLASDSEWLARSYSQMVQQASDRRRNRGGVPESRMPEHIEQSLSIYPSESEAPGVERAFLRVFKSMKWCSIQTSGTQD